MFINVYIDDVNLYMYISVAIIKNVRNFLDLDPKMARPQKRVCSFRGRKTGAMTKENHSYNKVRALACVRLILNCAGRNQIKSGNRKKSAAAASSRYCLF